MFIPQIPTDNLYKFASIAGLTILLISLIYVDRNIAEIEQKVTEYQNQSELLVIEKNNLAEEKKLLDGLKNRSSEQIKSFREKRYQVLYKIAQIQGENRKIDALFKRTDRLLLASLVGAIFGGVFCIYGFSAWYRHVQRPTDQLLLKQLNDKTDA